MAPQKPTAEHGNPSATGPKHSLVAGTKPPIQKTGKKTWSGTAAPTARISLMAVADATTSKMGTNPLYTMRKGFHVTETTPALDQTQKDDENIQEASEERPELTNDNSSHSLEATVIEDHQNDSSDAMESTDETDGFTVVTHRRNRTTGVPVLLLPAIDGSKLQNVNPLHLSVDVTKAAGGKILHHRFTQKGGLLVDVAEEAAVKRLLKVTELCGVAIKASLPRAYTQNKGLIKGIPRWYTVEQLAEYLQPQGVVAVRRLYRRNGITTETTPTDRVVLSFRPNSERPSEVSLGFSTHRVHEHTDAPPRCFKCQAMGHVAKYCTGSLTCKKCSGPHHHRDCPKDVRKCTNCGDPHPADYANCKVRLAALARTKAFLRGPILRPGEKIPTERAPPSSHDVAETTPTPRFTKAAKKKRKPHGRLRSTTSQQMSDEEEDFPSLPQHQIDSANHSHDSSSSRDTQQQHQHKARRYKSYSSALEGRPTETNRPAVTIIQAIFATFRQVLMSMPQGPHREALQGILQLESLILSL